MKNILLLFLVFISYKGIAQDWSCAVEDKKFFYINGTGYLRMMMYDSVQTNGNNVHYYPYKTIRATPCFNIYDIETVDSNGASWWGKELIATDTGYTFLYNHINDTIVIKNNAALNDSWILYTTDSLDFVYQATVTQIDTMTILGNVDSVKIITISVFDKMNNPVADSTNGTEIILSKEHGLVQTLDWYMFPYRDNNGYLNVNSECGYKQLFFDGRLYKNFNIKYLIFSISTIKQLTNFELNDFNIGEWFLDSWSNLATGSLVNTFRKILSKITTDTSIQYTIYRDKKIQYQGNFNQEIDTTLLTVQNTIIIDTLTLFPERNTYPDYATFYYYFPLDSSYCFQSPRYLKIYNNLYQYSYQIGPNIAYKTGLGQIYSYSGSNQSDIYSSHLTSAQKNANDFGCNGNNLLVGSINVNINKSSQFTLYPNPAHTFINLDFNGIDNNNTSLIMYNVTGKEVLRQSNIQQHTPIDIRNIPIGLYFIKLQSGEYFGTQKLVIER